VDSLNDGTQVCSQCIKIFYNEAVLIIILPTIYAQHTRIDVMLVQKLLTLTVGLWWNISAVFKKMQLALLMRCVQITIQSSQQMDEIFVNEAQN